MMIAEPSSTSYGAACTLFDLRDDALVILDEPGALESAASEIRERLAETLQPLEDISPSEQEETAYEPRLVSSGAVAAFAR